MSRSQNPENKLPSFRQIVRPIENLGMTEPERPIDFRPFKYHVRQEDDGTPSIIISAHAPDPCIKIWTIVVHGVLYSCRIVCPKGWTKPATDKFMEYLKFVMKENQPARWVVEERFPIDGYVEKPDTVITAFFYKYDAVKHCRNLLSKPRVIQRIGPTALKFVVVEDKIPLHQQYLQQAKLSTTQWIRIIGTYREEPGWAKDIYKETEIHVDFKNVLPTPEDVANTYRVTPLIMAFDIECNSHNRSFPNYADPRDQMFAISVDFRRGPKTQRYLLTALPHYTPDTIVATVDEDVQQLHCQDRDYMVDVFCQLILKKDPSFIAGHNILFFDMIYILSTMATMGKPMPDIGRFRDGKPRYEMEEFLTSTRGVGTKFHMDGRVFIDTVQLYMCLFPSLPSYTLKDLALRFLSNEKDSRKLDVDHHEIFAAAKATFDARRPDEVRLAKQRMDGVLQYAMVDSALVQQLLTKCNAVNGMISLAFYSYTEPEDAQSGRQRQNWCNLMYHRGAHMGYYQTCTPYENPETVSKNLQGGLVIDVGTDAKNIKRVVVGDEKLGAVRNVKKRQREEDEDSGESDDENDADSGLYVKRKPGKKCARVYDFMSLYPSVIRAHNMCKTTNNKGQFGAQGDEVISAEFTELCDELETYEEEVEIPEGISKYFVKSSNEPKKQVVIRKRNVKRVKKWKREFVPVSRRKGIIPQELEKFHTMRQAMKKRMKVIAASIDACTDAETREDLLFQYNKLDGDQNNMKLMMNSSYGYLATDKEDADMGIAQAITGMSRRYLRKCYEFLVKEGYTVVYADTDSLMVECTFEELKNEKAGNELAQRLTNLCPEPMVMEFEESVIMLIVKSKMYARYVVDKAGNVDYSKLHVKGMMTKRRNHAKLIGKLFDDILRALLAPKDDNEIFHDVLDLLVAGLTDLVEGRWDAAGLAVTTRYNPSVDSGQVWEFAQRLKSTGMQLQSKDNLSYVVIQGPDPKVSARMRLLTELTDKDHLDTEYYIKACKRIDTNIAAMFADRFKDHKWKNLDPSGICQSAANAFKKQIPWTKIVEEITEFRNTY